jgi:hypothetical protein
MRSATLLPLLLLLTATATPAQAQAKDKDDDRWQIATVNDDYIWDIRLVRLAGDSLVFRQADTLGSVNVERIRELRLIRKTTVTLGGGEGAAGTMAALTGSDDEVYDLQTLDFAARLRAIQQIFLAHPPKP